MLIGLRGMLHHVCQSSNLSIDKESIAIRVGEALRKSTKSSARWSDALEAMMLNGRRMKLSGDVRRTNLVCVVLVNGLNEMEFIPKCLEKRDAAQNMFMQR